MSKHLRITSTPIYTLYLQLIAQCKNFWKMISTYYIKLFHSFSSFSTLCFSPNPYSYWWNISQWQFRIKHSVKHFICSTKCHHTHDLMPIKPGFHFSRNSQTNKRMLNSACANIFFCIFADDSLWSPGSSNKLNFFGE